jgi:hypothetical protein
MGIYTDLLTDTVAWDSGGHDDISVATDRVITQQVERLLASQGDIAYPSGYAETDEVQSIGTYNGSVTGGNFTLTISPGLGGASHTTANIAYNANASTIESAIDTVATGNVAGWTNGDISVTGGDLTTSPVVLTYDGASVDATNHDAVVINDVDLSGGGTVGDVSTTTNGQTDRPSMAVLNSIGLVTSPPPAQGTITGLTASLVRGANPLTPGAQALQALAMQAAIEDGSQALYIALMEAWGLQAML